MSTIGRFGAVISFVGIVVVSYKIGKYHAASGYSSSPSSSSRNTKHSSNFPKKDMKNVHTKHGTNEAKADQNGDKINLNSQRNDNHEKSKLSLIGAADGARTTTPSSKRNIIQPKPEETLESITLKPIGQISSVYRLCVGTPRQGLLAPNSRGRIDLYPNQISSESVLDLDQYSHLWIVFIFHLNSLTSKQRANKQFPAKIKPPALGGKRVGVFATRTPHRPNPVGFSLCKIDKIVIPQKKKGMKAKDLPYSVYVSGLDLVDGTPVLDIKPYVPHYDSVGYMGMGMKDEIINNDNGANITNHNNNNVESSNVDLPQWVSEGLDKRRPVTFTNTANDQLVNIMMNDETANQMEFYGPSTGRDDNNEEALERIKSCIEEVLSVDVRSSFQTKKARKGQFQAERAIRVSNVIPSHEANPEHNQRNTCTQQLDKLLITYTVVEVENSNADGRISAVNTLGSGADDKIVVIKIEMIPNQKKK